MAEPASIHRRKRSHDVAEELEAAIGAGEFRPGDRLPSELELTRRFGVGRPAVREALFLLQERGRVAIANGARAQVTEPTPEFLIGRLSQVATRLAGLPEGQKHLEETRLVFESGLAWLAAQGATGGDVERLRAALDANVAAQGDAEQFIRTDVAFHVELARIARNPIFDAFHRVLVDWLVDQRAMTINLPDADSLSVRDHRAIFEAVAAGDPARAYHEMASHLRLIGRLYAEARRLRETLLRDVTRDVAVRTGQESAEIWRASFADGDDVAAPPDPEPDAT